jgi:hypothetical protein
MMSRAKLQSFKLNMATSGTILRIGAAPRRSPAVATRVTRNGIHYSRYLSRPPARARTRAPHLRPIPTSSPLTLPAADPRRHRHHRPALSRPTSARGRPAEGRAAPRRDGRDAPDQWPGQARGPRDWQPTLLPSTPAPVPADRNLVLAAAFGRRFWPPLLAAAFGRRFWPTLDGSPLASLPPSHPSAPAPSPNERTTTMAGTRLRAMHVAGPRDRCARAAPYSPAHIDFTRAPIPAQFSFARSHTSYSTCS